MKDADLSLLDDYLRGADVPAEYEEDLFARALAGAAPELAFREGLGQTLRTMQARGTLDVWATKHQVERLLASGHRVRSFELDVRNPSMPDLTGEFDLLVTRIPLPLEGVDRLDAEVFSPDGRLLKRLPDIPFDASEGAVYVVCEAELARTSASVRSVTKVFAREPAGPRLLLEFALA